MAVLKEVVMYGYLKMGKQRESSLIFSEKFIEIETYRMYTIGRMYRKYVYDVTE